MHRFRNRYALGVLVLCLSFAGLVGISVSVSTETARAANPGKRAISTAPSITETLFALGEGRNVVGVSEFCRFPAAALKIQRIGSYLSPNQEVILSLRPDRVYIEDVSAPKLRNLNSKGFQTFMLRHRNIEDIYRSVDVIATGQGVPEAGKVLSEKIRSDLARLRAATSKLPKRRVLFIVGRTPGTLQGIVATGDQTYLNELIEIAGGVNCVSDAGAAYPKISLETLLARNPEVIIDRGDMAQTEKQTKAHEDSVRQLWQKLSTIDAVRQKRVYPVSEDYWVVPGPRVTEAAHALARLIHPEAGL